MKKLLATLVTLVMIVSSLAVLTSCGAKDGLTPTIGENGNWFIGEEDTGVPATGPKGDKGDKGDRGNAGQDGTAGTAGTNGATPTFRINGETGALEISYDGKTWTEVEFVTDGEPSAPAIDSNLLDDSLTEYAYPMNTVLPAEGVITYYFEDGDPDQHKYMVDELNKVAFIYIEGTVFDAVRFTGNEERWLGWTFLTEMPELGDAVSYAGDYDGVEASGRGPGELSNPVTIPDDAKVLVVYYQDCMADGSGLAVYVPGGILFVKDAE